MVSPPPARGPWSPNAPFAPARAPFFYGWAVAVVSMIGVIGSVPGQTMGISVFTDVFVAELGLTRLQLSAAYLLGTLLSGLILPWGGKLFDHWGARRTLVLVALLQAGILLYLAGSAWLARLLGAVLPPGAGTTVSFAVIAFGFLGVRFFGQGMLTMASRAMLGKWWHVRRGLVLSLSSVGVVYVHSLTPKLLHDLIADIGWQEALLLLAGLSGIALSLVLYLFARDNPEECGLLMDGGTRTDARPPHEDLVIVRDFTRAEALSSWTFWIYVLAFSWFSFFFTGYVFHMLDLADDFGVPRERILELFIPTAFVSVVANLLGGYLSDRTRLRHHLALYAVASGMAAGGILLFPATTGYTLLIIGSGVTQGLFGMLTGVVFARYYGRTHLGAISGVSTSAMVIASALGPVTFSVVKLLTGSYAPIVAAGIGVAVVLLAGSFFVSNPQRRLLLQGHPPGEDA